MQKRQITSNRLNVNAGIMAWYVKELKNLTKQMTAECVKELTKIYGELGYQTELCRANVSDSERRPEVAKTKMSGDDSAANDLFLWNNSKTTEFATDDSISSQIRIALNQLYKKYGDKFSERAKELVKSLLKKTNRYSNLQINEAIKSMVGDKSKDFALKGSAISPEKAEIMKALTFGNVSLIKSIPNEYFKQITGAVSRSIQNGGCFIFLLSIIIYVMI